jgi:cardiolipin synthase
VLRYLPNALTFSRLLLAVPLGIVILGENYPAALMIGFVAGLTDALDGFFARRLGVFSRFGAALDPIADKVLVTVSFLCLAQVQLIPWYLALAVIARDLIIVAGALCYHWLIGPFDFAASNLSKANMFIQIGFCVLVLLVQVVPSIPAVSITIGMALVLFIAASSGFDYVSSWTIKAIQVKQQRSPRGD